MLSLEARAKKDDILIGDTPKARRRRRRLDGVSTAGRLWKHSKLCDIEGLVTQEEIDSFFVFTIVRNPWDRLVSYYHWLLVQEFDHPAVRLAKSASFSDFLAQDMIRKSFLENSSASYVRSPRGSERCDLFLELETLNDTLATLSTALGTRRPPVHVVNRSERARDYRRYYPEKDAAKVAVFCAEDIARFGYRFD